MPLRFGPYQLLRRIAVGGMGEVHLALLEKEGGFSKVVAVKTILPTFSCRLDFIKLFDLEATVAASLNHANIVQIFDHGCIDGRSYFTMEFVEGLDLAALLFAHQRRPLSTDVAAEIGVQLCRGLSHAHDRTNLQGKPLGIVHGDISPTNVLLSKEGQVKLTDFGLARIREIFPKEKWVAGKCSYMSPEQTLGNALTAQSDLFSLGLLLYEMFTGKQAYPLHNSWMETIQNIQNGNHPPASTSNPLLSKEVEVILSKSLATNPGFRFSTASELSIQLTAVCSPCGPDKLSEFIASKIPEDQVKGCLLVESTHLAKNPVGPIQTDPQRKRTGLLLLVLLLLTSWFAWYHFPTQNKSTPAFISSLPLSSDQQRKIPVNIKPAKHSSHKGDQLQTQPSKQKTANVPSFQETIANQFLPTSLALRVEIESGWRIFLDHQLQKGTSFDIHDIRPTLLRLLPDQKDSPEIVVRVTPLSTSQNSWTLTLTSDPWMNVQLNRRLLGQTPRSHVALNTGQSALRLTRGNVSIKIRFTVGVLKQNHPNDPL